MDDLAPLIIPPEIWTPKSVGLMKLKGGEFNDVRRS